MSFRFQKRVKIAPGIRLNISKGGVSTSVGRRGASVTLGKRGLYGNVGIPGSGLSYRTKINKNTTGRQANTWYQKDTKNIPRTISLVYEKSCHSLVFVDENGERVPDKVEKDIRKEFRDDIRKLYEQKEKEINEQTTKLLYLHKEPCPKRSPDDLKQLAKDGLQFHLTEPNKSEIFQELKVVYEDDLGFFEKIRLLFPSKRKAFLQSVQVEADEQYNFEMNKYTEAKELFEEEKQQRLLQVDKIINGCTEAMEAWLENYLVELDFPLETNVSFVILSKSIVYLDVDLPQMEEIPLTKASILKSGKLKVENKSQREMREHYATMVGGTALYLCSYVFSLLPTCEAIIISGYTQVDNKSTGHLDDQYIYSLKVDKETFYNLNITNVHPIHAFENFEPIINATKTYIFKEIKPYEPVLE